MLAYNALLFVLFAVRKGLSTYDFIVQNRQAAAVSAETDNNIKSPSKLKPCKVFDIYFYKNAMNRSNLIGCKLQIHK